MILMATAFFVFLSTLFEENRKLLSEIARLIRAWLRTEHVPLVHLAEGALSNPLLLLIELFGVCVALLIEKDDLRLEHVVQGEAADGSRGIDPYHRDVCIYWAARGRRCDQ